MSQTSLYFAAAIFALAVLHTFATKWFEHRAHRSPNHGGLWHLLGEVEVVFGLWALVLILGLWGLQGQKHAIDYLESCNFTEPLFVFAVMAIAATQPLLMAARRLVFLLARLAPGSSVVAAYFICLSVVPLLGSFITEPAAMTVAAILLRDRYFVDGVSTRFKYATLAVLLVNISIGGTLTPYAAPPVLMVASKWNWDISFMLATFGWKAALAVCVNALIVTARFRRELLAKVSDTPPAEVAMPAWVIVVHGLFLLATVIFSHHPVVFMGMFLFFLGFTAAYPRFQSPLLLRESLLVAFFLAGLVVIGGPQSWWLQPIIENLGPDSLFFGATGLTAITDNAALTYLGSLINGLSPEARYALVAGAVTGGGLTVIANAPNPAGFALLRERFDEGAISPLGLFRAALLPTLCAGASFYLL
ncbi:putative Na+/H+ antiporter [Parachitinimonas caeni]|uniref:Na+/H+ antiporter n=1 Tax=Parachitinimonas caeni TaxID=3031301 RepID=A0ABT7DUR1_9NEIS|nr:putative Na+/H+ antiporter [Parachitinimonas caeni]MDK2122828.1 putative Na+/H+ antiporter [Parachitinimonas caeni]